MEPEKLLQCPYDKNHQIRASRFPYHLVKCSQNNQKIARDLVTCPYNARHRIAKQEFNLHVEQCESKVAPEVYGAGNILQKRNKELVAYQGPPSKEDWEADAEIAPAPFVFGTRRLELLQANAQGVKTNQLQMKILQKKQPR